MKRRVKDGFEYFAAKFYNVGDNRDRLQTFRDRMNSLVSLSHPHVMPIVGVIEPTKIRGPILITRYSEHGSLSEVLDRVRNNDPPSFWTSEGKLRMIVSLISGFLYLHSQGIVHGEMKPSELIVEHDGSIRLCGYITSIFEEHHYTWAPEVGAPWYMAPEVYEDRTAGDKVRDPKTDVFSFSLILYEILFGQKVFPPSMSAAVIMRRAMSVRPQDRPTLPRDVHPVLREVIQRRWNASVQKRPDFEWIWKRLREVCFKVIPDVEVKLIPLSSD
jgi:serine/threonine protein kinase